MASTNDEHHELWYTYKSCSSGTLSTNPQSLPKEKTHNTTNCYERRDFHILAFLLLVPMGVVFCLGKEFS
jgi:hypothetical protein